MKERRSERRYSVNEIPDFLKVVTVQNGFFSEEYPASLYDVSSNGMSLEIDAAPINLFKKDDTITIKVMPFKYKLKAKIIYVEAKQELNLVGPNDISKLCKIKMGVRLKKGKSLELFQNMLELNMYKDIKQ